MSTNHPDLDALLREHAWLTRLTRRLLGDGPDADDLAQETLTRALGHAGPVRSSGESDRGQGRIEGSSSRGFARGWLATIARNLTLERRRADARRVAREREIARSAGESLQGLDAEAIDRAHMRRELIDEVLRLPEPERSALVLHYFEGLSHVAIAERLGISPAASRKRVSRSVQRLRERFDRGPAGVASLAVLLVPLDAARHAAPVAAVAAVPASVPAATFIMSLQTKLALAVALLVLATVSIVSVLGPLDAPANGRGEDVDVARGAGGPAAAEGGPALDGRDAVGAGARTAIDAEASTSGPPVTHRIFGRVVDAARRPVADAEVLVRPAAAIGASTRTGSDGSFSLPVALEPLPPGGYPDLAVVADGGEGRAAADFVRYPSPSPGEVHDVDAGTLVLQPSYALEVLVTGGADSVSVALSHERRPWGDFALDSAGRAVIEGLPAGPVHLETRAEGAAARAVAFVPEATSIELVLQPVPAIRVAVRDRATKDPIVGAELMLSEAIAIPAAASGWGRRRMAGEYHSLVRRHDLARVTGADGVARVECPAMAGADSLTLRVTAEGYRSPQHGTKVTAETGALEVELERAVGRAVHWPIVAGEVPVPGDGTAIELVPLPGDGRLPDVSPGAEAPSIQAGELVVPGLVGRARVLARTTGGAISRIYVKEDDERGAEISFRRPRSVRVRALGPDGKAVVGARVEARDQGNNSLCDAVRTTRDGVALLEGLYGGLAEVHVEPEAASDLRGGIVGTVDLDGGDAELEVTLEANLRRRARLRIHIADALRLPVRYDLRGMTPVRVVEEDPDHAELLVEVVMAHAQDSVELWLDAEGCAPETVLIPFATGADVPRVDVTLEPTACVVAHVTVATGARVQVNLEQRDVATGAWAVLRGSGSMALPNGPGGTFVFRGVGLGEWRLFDRVSKMSSPTFAVAADDATLHVDFDLSAIAWVSGIVETEDPAELARARILVDDGGGAQLAPGQRPGMNAPQGSALEAGAFRVRVPGDREVHVSVWHPWLTPDSESGRIAVRGGRDSVVLRLRSGDELRLPVPQLAGPWVGRAARRVRVARYAAGVEPQGLPMEWSYAPVVDGVARCGLPAGTWTLLVEPGERFAPLVLNDVVIDGLTELPPAAFVEGSALVVSVLVPEGAEAPRIYAFASSLDEPGYGRDLNSSGESPVKLTGFGPGRFKVVLGSIMDPENRREFEVELDGEHDLDVELDARK